MAQITKPVYKQKAVSTAFDQTFSQQMLAKGDWSPGENTKKYIKNPMSLANNEQYQKLFCQKKKRMSISNSAIDLAKTTKFENARKTEVSASNTHRILHPSI